MDKIKPITLGIIALLLVLLTFNFIPKETPTPTKPQTTEESKPSTQQTNEELIQKNLDFLKENLPTLKEQYPLDSQTSTQSPLQSPQQSPQIPQPSQRLSSPQTPQIPQDSTHSTHSTPQTNPESTPLESQFQESHPQQSQLLESQPTKTPLSKPKSQPPNPKLCPKSKPQLAIIIDDISNLEQYRRVQQIPYKVTPSFFPKTAASQNTPKIAATAPFYMVHLPLEALNFYQKEHSWLFSHDSKQTIQSRIEALKRDFPNLTYLNNHTGSKFTQNLQAMGNLLNALNANGITFVDSRTTPKTKTSLHYQNNPTTPLNPCQNTPFLERNVFLDNELDISKITQNLIKAVEIAKTKGYAIAIGHPHKETILALKNAAEYLKQSGVEAVYIKELVIPWGF